MPFASNSSSACAAVAHRKTNAQSSMSGRLMTTMLRRCLLSTASKPSNGHPTKSTTTITSTTDVDGGVSTPHRHGPDCWSCGARDDKSMFFCRHCDAIQAPRANTTAFDVFDCAESFDVDVQQLSQRFKQLQVKLHPDKWATRTPVRWLVCCCDALLNFFLQDELAIAQRTSAFVNTSYQTIKSPAKRAEYLVRVVIERCFCGSFSQCAVLVGATRHRFGRCRQQQGAWQRVSHGNARIARRHRRCQRGLRRC